jgi:hypothetical protein
LHSFQDKEEKAHKELNQASLFWLMMKIAPSLWKIERKRKGINVVRVVGEGAPNGERERGSNRS